MQISTRINASLLLADPVGGQKKSLAAILGEGNDCAAREACRPDFGGETRDSKKLRISGYWGIGGANP